MHYYLAALETDGTTDLLCAPESWFTEQALLDLVGTRSFSTYRDDCRALGNDGRWLKRMAGLELEVATRLYLLAEHQTEAWTAGSIHAITNEIYALIDDGIFKPEALNQALGLKE